MKHGTIVQNMWQPSHKSYLVYLGTSEDYANCLWIIDGKLSDEIHKFYKRDILNDREHFPIVGYVDYKNLLTNAVLSAVQNDAESDMTSSHSEKDILNGCISLMQSLMGRFEEYLDFIDFHPDPDYEEERFCTEFYMTEIVERLFLWHTRHSGGTSQMMKLRELGEERETVTFEDERGQEDDD
jgi:hypothetical protein